MSNTIYTLKTNQVIKRSDAVVSKECDMIVRVVSDICGVSMATIKADNRNDIGAKPRFICMYLMNQISEMSYKKVAVYFGRTNHSTVIHAIQSVEEKIVE